MQAHVRIGSSQWLQSKYYTFICYNCHGAPNTSSSESLADLTSLPGFRPDFILQINLAEVWEVMADLGVMGTRLWLTFMSWEPGSVAELFGVMGTRLWLTLVSWEPGYDWPWCHGNQAMVDHDVMGMTSYVFNLSPRWGQAESSIRISFITPKLHKGSANTGWPESVTEFLLKTTPVQFSDPSGGPPLPSLGTCTPSRHLPGW